MSLTNHLSLEDLVAILMLVKDPKSKILGIIYMVKIPIEVEFQLFRILITIIMNQLLTLVKGKILWQFFWVVLILLIHNLAKIIL